MKLSAMLASEGKSRPEGLFGTCKTGTTPGMIVVNTAVNISACCFSNILGGALYVVSPNPISSLGVAILITTISIALMVICNVHYLIVTSHYLIVDICLYLRFG